MTNFVIGLVEALVLHQAAKLQHLRQILFLEKIRQGREVIKMSILSKSGGVHESACIFFVYNSPALAPDPFLRKRIVRVSKIKQRVEVFTIVLAYIM